MNSSNRPSGSTPSVSRRQFVQTASAAAGIVAMPSFIQAQRSAPPSGKLNIACIGVGGKGKSDVADAGRYGNVVALCDIDLKGDAAKTVANFPKARTFTDYRVMFDKMGSEIDAVTVSVPDHSHYPAAMMALERGKHVFVQKPLANTIWEARQLLLASREAGVVTQMGIQGHTFEGIRLLKEWLDAGAIGEVEKVRYWTNRPIWPQGVDVEWKSASRPADINWDVWQGTVTPERPYSPDLHPKKWRASWDYGCGALGDIGCHLFDAAFWALDLGMPDEVVAESRTDFTDQMAPSHSVIKYRFTRNRSGKKIKPVEFHWSDGALKPNVPEEMGPDGELHEEFGQIITGSKGKIYSPSGYCETLRLIPESAMRAFDRPAKSLPRVKGGPIKEWIDSIHAGKQPGANFEYAARLTEVVLLGNLAVRLGKPIKWNSDTMSVVGAPEADSMIKRAYRDGWSFKEYKA